MTYTYPGDESIVLHDADVIGHSTSYREGQLDAQRWSEATVVLTADLNYFVAVVGRSEVAGETDRHWALFHTDAIELIRALLRRQGDTKALPKYLHRALAEAAAEDDNLNEALDAYDAAGLWR